MSARIRIEPRAASSSCPEAPGAAPLGGLGRRPRIALLTANAGRGGVVNVVWSLAEGLVRRFECDVCVASDAGSETNRLLSVGVRHVLVPFASGTRSTVAAVRSLRRFYREYAPDVVHSHSRWPSMVSVVAGRRPDVSTLHAQGITRRGSRFDLGVLRRVFSQWGRLVTVLDEEVKTRLSVESGLPADRILVVPNGVDASLYRPPATEERLAARGRWGIGGQDRVLLFVGDLNAVKRPILCVETLALATRSSSNVILLLVGDGECRAALEAEAGRRGVAGRCIQLGWLDKVRDAYWAADLLMLPSREEGFGLVCAEAMLCGVPVVRTRTGGCSTQIVEGETGWAFDTQDIATLESEAARIVLDEALCRRVGDQARAHALATFTMDRFLDRVWDAYRLAQFPPKRPRR